MDVLDSTGRYLQEIELPDRFRVMRFQGPLIYGIQRDELDQQVVMRLRLIPGGGESQADPSR